MELDREMWRRAVMRVRRVAWIARLLWWLSMLAPPLVAVVAFPELLWGAVVVAVLALLFTDVSSSVWARGER
jgi:hypothetical protein